MIDEEKYLYALETATQPVYVNKIIALDNTDKEADSRHCKVERKKYIRLPICWKKCSRKRTDLLYWGREYGDSDKHGAGYPIR